MTDFAALIVFLVFVCNAPTVAAESSATVKLLSDRGSTRATRYANANKIVTLGSKTHVAWLDSISRTMIATFDQGSGQWSPAIHIGDGVDNHGGPALTCDSRGYLHIVFGPHAESPFQHFRSARPNDATEWVRQPAFGQHATYPSLVCSPDDTLHIIYRGGPQPRHPFALLYQRKPRGGPWTKPIPLARCPDDWKEYTAYHATLSIDVQGKLHAALNLYYRGRAQDVGYLKSIDGGRSWLRADDLAVAVPVTTESSAIIYRSSDPLTVINVVCDHDGTPWILIGEKRQCSIRAYHDGQWRVLIANTFLSAKQRAADLTWGTLTIVEDGRLVVPAVIGQRVVGGVVGDVWLLVSDRQKQHFQPIHVVRPDEFQPHTGLSLERFTGHNRVAEPWLLFSTGPKGPDTIGKGLHHQVRAVRPAR